MFTRTSHSVLDRTALSDGPCSSHHIYPLLNHVLPPTCVCIVVCGGDGWSRVLSSACNCSSVRFVVIHGKRHLGPHQTEASGTLISVLTTEGVVNAVTRESLLLKISRLLLKIKPLVVRKYRPRFLKETLYSPNCAICYTVHAFFKPAPSMTHEQIARIGGTLL